MEKDVGSWIDRSLLLLIIERRKAYTATSNGLNGETKSGILYKINDSSIELIILNSAKNKISIVKIPVGEIKNFEIKRHTAKFTAIGAITGFGLGLILGLGGDDGWFSKEVNAIGTGVAFGFFGGILGKTIGSFKIKVPINGSIENLNKNKTKLTKYTIH